MNRLLLCLCVLLLPTVSVAGEKVSGTNTYMLNEKQWPTEHDSVFWTLSNFGTFETTVGPLGSGPVECHGSGFWDHNGAKGEGICIFGSDADTFTFAWKAEPGKTSTWKIVRATGKYADITGAGTHVTRKDTAKRIMPVRITDWQGEIELPK